MLTCSSPFINDFLVITNYFPIGLKAIKKVMFLWTVNCGSGCLGGNSPPPLYYKNVSPLPQHCGRSVPTVTKLSSTMVTAGPFEAISTPQMFFFSSSPDPFLPPFPPIFLIKNKSCFDLSHKWSWHINKQHNHPDTQTHKHAQWVM